MVTPKEKAIQSEETAEGNEVGANLINSRQSQKTEVAGTD